MKQESITPQYRPLPSEKYRVLPFTSLPSPRIKPYAQVRVSVGERPCDHLGARGLGEAVAEVDDPGVKVQGGKVFN